jgi:hypothetical protein
LKLIDSDFYKYASPDGLSKTLRLSAFSAPLRLSRLFLLVASEAFSGLAGSSPKIII